MARPHFAHVFGIFDKLGQLLSNEADETDDEEGDNEDDGSVEDKREDKALLGSRPRETTQRWRGATASSVNPTAIAKPDFETLIKADPMFLEESVRALRHRLQLSSPEMVKLCERCEFVSLGGFCGVSQALASIGLRKAAQPFDWVRSPMGGIMHCLETGFEDFLSFRKVRSEHGHTVFENTAWGGSFWHHDIQAAETRAQFARRCGRFLGTSGGNQSSKPRMFFRVANSSQELAHAPKLLAALKLLYPKAPVYLLMMADAQKQSGLIRIDNESHRLLYHRVEGELWTRSYADVREQMGRCSETYATCISAAIRFWAMELEPSWQSAQRPHSLPNVAALKAVIDPYDGGDPATSSYSPTSSGNQQNYDNRVDAVATATTAAAATTAATAATTAVAQVATMGVMAQMERAASMQNLVARQISTTPGTSNRTCRPGGAFPMYPGPHQQFGAYGMPMTAGQRPTLQL